MQKFDTVLRFLMYDKSMLRCRILPVCFLAVLVLSSAPGLKAISDSAQSAAGPARQRRETCSSGDCKNGGFCNPYLESTATCICLKPFTGVYCTIRLDNCATSPCRNGGTCSSTDVSPWYGCSCVLGFTGVTCETNIDDCASRPCANGQCADGVNSYSCSCYSGWEGSNCNINHDDCFSGACFNGGRCLDGNGTFSCDCAGTGYSGSRCAEHFDDCWNNPCKNGGTCVDAFKDYSCNCLAGYSGKNCTVDFNDCPPKVCSFGGTCLERSNQALYGSPTLPPPFNGLFNYSAAAGFVCICPPGAFGPTCSENPNDCLLSGSSQSVCVQASGCTDGLNDYQCHCLVGYEGKNCSQEVDECLSRPCRNGGVCIDGKASFTCNCAGTDFYDSVCSSRINDCRPNPCLNDGLCVDGHRSYSCICQQGYSGTNCSVDFPDCNPNPCDPGGFCLERSDPTHYNSTGLPWPFNGSFSHVSAAGYVCLYDSSYVATLKRASESKTVVVASVVAVVIIAVVIVTVIIIYVLIRLKRISLIFNGCPGRDINAHEMPNRFPETPRQPSAANVDTFSVDDSDQLRFPDEGRDRTGDGEAQPTGNQVAADEAVDEANDAHIYVLPDRGVIVRDEPVEKRAKQRVGLEGRCWKLLRK